MPVFLGWMNIKAQAHAKAFPDKLSLETVQSVKTFTEFNSRITAPLFDFSSPDVRVASSFMASSWRFAAALFVSPPTSAVCAA